MDKEYLDCTVEQLREVGVSFQEGLSDAEVEAVQHRFGFTFPPDLRALLQTALPISWSSKWGTSQATSFPDWRSGDEDELRKWLDWPYEGICFDICNNRFWMDDWGTRPPSDKDACAIARLYVANAPTLIPIFAHRFIPDSPDLAGNPVYSVWQTDIIYYGFDLADYLANEFSIGNLTPKPAKPQRVKFWSELPGMWEPEWD